MIAKTTTHASPLAERARRISTLNDAFRRGEIIGRMMVTAGVMALGVDAVAMIVAAVAAYDAFEADNDPHAERDFGSLEHEGGRLFWKIDYYDAELISGSPDPADPSITTRVLTIMRADEY